MRTMLLALAFQALLAAPAPAQDHQTATSSTATREEINTRAVLGFYKAVSRFDYEAARPYIGPYYVQHSPLIEDGLTGLKKALDQFRAEFKGRPFPVLDVKQVFAEGDYVVMLSHIILKPGTPGIAVADLFRLQDGKLAEHWDVTETLPARPTGEGMFDRSGPGGTGPGVL